MKKLIDTGMIKPRDVVGDAELQAHILCAPCRFTVPVDLWRVPPIMRDATIGSLRFRCQRCGTRARLLTITRIDGRGGATTETIEITLRG
jgi:hypothetical protein